MASSKTYICLTAPYNQF
uniref:Uncharacterized protein n=1 Tax=Anguilla anguilla TaxID=7936 RepID=A0A0E9XDD4_ANGAN